MSRSMTSAFEAKMESGRSSTNLKCLFGIKSPAKVDLDHLSTSLAL
jgi:hypothetical protein